MAKDESTRDPDGRAGDTWLPGVRNRSMDVTEISTGTSSRSEAEAQEAPPGPQEPALDPSAPASAEEAAEAGELDAGAMWPREPGAPADPSTKVAPFSTAMGTNEVDAEAASTDTKIVTPEGGEEASRAKSQRGGTESRDRRSGK